MPSNVPYVNLSAQWQDEKNDLLPIINRVLSSGTYVSGEEVGKFEAIAATLCKTKHCVALNSGTDALVCALKALGVSRGDEVITPPNSFIASTSSIVHIGAIPVFCDVLENQNIDPSKIEPLITKKTKAIMPVHLGGRVADMDAIMHIADKHNLYVVEDAAQSVGSSFSGKMSGSIGHIGCFSTHPLKNLNACGDGGFITTNDANIADIIRSMRSHGLVDRNTVETFGYVSRMDELQAAILTHRASRLAETIERRCKNAELYSRHLDRELVFIPPQDRREVNTYHTFVIQVDRRDELANYLASKSVQTAIHYPVPIHLQPAARKLGYKKGDFEATERQAARILTLPINQSLEPKQILYVSELINKFLGGSVES
jgi:dTDP-4-amino-4,6-dideoxygalactose transaminase